MSAWIGANIGTLLIGVALAGILAAVVAGLARNRKKGKSSCGCNCARCPMGGSCHKS